MKFWRHVREVLEWLPLPLVVGVAVLATRGFREPLSFELGMILVLLFVGNLAWILIMRGLRQQREFRKKFPGFKGQING